MNKCTPESVGNRKKKKDKKQKLLTSQKKSLQVAEVEIAGGAFFRPPQCDKGFFR